jgi:hypothetical protein
MVSRVTTAGIATAAALLLIVSASAVGRSSTPVLGSRQAFPNGAGFGTVKPRHVFLGGDPTGNVTSVSWRNWGSQRSAGFGTGWCPGRSVASGHSCSVSLHAFRLGSCHHRRAYTAMTFYFKSRPSSRWKLGSKWNVCSGTAG